MQDIAAERGVLSGVAKFGIDAFDDICDMVGPDTFSDPDNQLLWAAFDDLCRNHNAKTIQFPDLCSAFNRLRLGELSKENVQYFRALNNTPVVIEGVRRHAATIRKLEIARKLDNQLDIAKSNLKDVRGDEPIDKILSMAENPIFDFTSLLSNTQFQGVRRMGDGARSYLEHVMDNPRELMGISTGFKRFDMAIGGGLRRGSVDIVGARQKTGKTQFVDNVGVNIAKQKIHVLNVDTEMDWEEHVHRIAANMAGVAVYDIETGRVTHRPQDRQRVLEMADKLNEYPYDYLCVRDMPFQEILSHMRRWVTRTVGLGPDGKANPCVIIYDYLKLMSAQEIARNMQEYQMLGFVSSSLKNFMGRYGIGCLCFSQLNREGINGEDSGVMRGADRILDVCTSFSIYKWKSDTERAGARPEHRIYTHKLKSVFTRHGEGLDPDDYINMESQYKFGRIVEGPLRSELEGQLNTTPKGIIVPDEAIEVTF